MIKKLIEHIHLCPIGYYEGKTITNTDAKHQDFIDWFEKLKKIVQSMSKPEPINCCSEIVLIKSILVTMAGKINHMEEQLPSGGFGRFNYGSEVEEQLYGKEEKTTQEIEEEWKLGNKGAEGRGAGDSFGC